MQELFIRRNIMGFILKITGIIVIVWGFIQALIVQSQFQQMYHGMDEFGNGMMGTFGGGVVPFFGVLLTNLLYGVLIIGFGEALDLLQKIYDQQHPEGAQAREQPALAKGQKASSAPTNAVVTLEAEKAIRSFYQAKGIEVDAIRPLAVRGMFAVSIGARQEVLDLGGFSPRLLSEEEASKYI